MNIARNPVAQFVLGSVLLVLAVTWVTDELARRAAEQEAVADARATTELLARTVVEPSLPVGIAREDNTIAARLFTTAARDRLLVDYVERVKIWDEAGRVVWSDQPELIGEVFELGPLARTVLEQGEARAGVSDLRRPENRFELEEDGLLEVYSYIESREGEPLLFEVYYAADELEDRTSTILATFRPVSAGGVLMLTLLATPLLWLLTRRLARSAVARERLLRDMVDASDRERRQVARDLHAEVVPGISAASSTLAAEASSADVPAAVARRLREVDDRLRESLGALRTLVVQVYPPHLDGEGLPAALEELLGKAAESGLRTSCTVDDLRGADRDGVALVWRVTREAVRNVLAHARARQVDVVVRRRGSALSLRVTDDGVGFVPGAFAHQDGFGLRALQDLVVELGGSLRVDSGPGRGTTVRLETAVVEATTSVSRSVRR